MYWEDYIWKVYGLWIAMGFFLIIIFAIIYYFLIRKVEREGTVQFIKNGDNYFWIFRSHGFGNFRSRYIFSSLDSAKADLREKMRKRGLKLED
jgi:hypothetical protein